MVRSPSRGLIDQNDTALVGMPLKAGIGTITSGGASTASTLDALWTGLKAGAVQVGLQLATKGLDPLGGALAANVVAGAIDGLISPPIQRDPKTGQPILDPATGKPKLVDTNHDGKIDAQDSKGIFAGISEGLKSAVGGFTEIGVVVPGNPVATAQGLAKLNDFTQLITTQGLGAALDTYATSLLNRSSIESLLNAGTSVRQYNTVAESVNVALGLAPTPAGKPKLVVENVTFEGKPAKQLHFGGEDFLLVDPTTSALIAAKEGDTFTQYTASPKVDPATHTAGVPNGIIVQTAEDGTRVRMNLVDGTIRLVEVRDPDGRKLTLTGNELKTLTWDKQGQLVEGTATDAVSGARLTFQQGRLTQIQRPLALLTPGAQPGQLTRTENAGTITETLDAQGKINARNLELAHALQNQHGALTVQTLDGGNAALVIDQTGQLVLQLQGNQAVAGDLTRLVQLWQGIPGVLPKGFVIPTDRPLTLNDFESMLTQQFKGATPAEDDLRKTLLKDLADHNKELSDKNLLPSTFGKQIVSTIESTTDLVGGKGSEKTVQQMYLGYKPSATPTSAATTTLVSDPTRSQVYYQLDTKQNVVQMGTTTVYGFTRWTQRFLQSPIEGLQGGAGTDLALQAVDQTPLQASLRLGVGALNPAAGTASLVITGNIQGLKDGQVLGTTLTKTLTFKTSGDKSDSREQTLNSLYNFFGSTPPKTVVVDPLVVRNWFATLADPFGVGGQLADGFLAMVRTQATQRGAQYQEVG